MSDKGGPTRLEEDNGQPWQKETTMKHESYVRPKDVVSPKKSWKLIKVLHKGKEDEWSAAKGEWEGDPVLALRWNGTREKKLGKPQSHGKAVWFIFPTDALPLLKKEMETLG